MEKSIFDLTIKIRNQKQLMKTTKVKDVVGAFVTKLRDLKTKMVFFIKIYLRMKMMIVLMEM